MTALRFFLPAALSLPVAVAAIGPATAAAAPAASFDCAKAGSAVEKMICADADLATLDATLGAQFKQALAAAGNGDALKARQRGWLTRVRNACATPACLATAYRQRIAELQKQGATAQAGPSPVPGIYVGGFTGKVRLELTKDGQIIKDGVTTGTYRTEPVAIWPDAKYPLVITPRAGGDAGQCKIQPDLRKLLCNWGGTLTEEYERQGKPPAIPLAAAKKCDDEQLYLDVMAAARRARPSLELKGSFAVTEQADGTCRIDLYYLKDGETISEIATYDKRARPVKLAFPGTAAKP